MRSSLVGLPLLAVAVGSCTYLNKPRFVGIDPEYAYVDGCTDVRLRGSSLGTAATAQIGGQDIVGLTAAAEDPSVPDYAQSVGFEYNGVSPAYSDPAGGFVDVTMTVDGTVHTLPQGFYYRPCPATVHADGAALVDETAAVGGQIAFGGCGLGSTVEVRFLNAADGTVAATGALASVCGTASATATIPTLAAGTYWVELAAGDGSTWGGWCDPAPDTDGVPDTGDPCAGLFSITLGGA